MGTVLLTPLAKILYVFGYATIGKLVAFINTEIKNRENKQLSLQLSKQIEDLKIGPYIKVACLHRFQQELRPGS